MDLARVKGLVQHLFADSESFQSFLRSPNEALAKYSLTGDERWAFMQLHSRLATANGAPKLGRSEPAEWP